MTKLLIKQISFTLLSLVFLAGCENPLGSAGPVDPNLGLKQIGNAGTGSSVPVCSAEQEASAVFLPTQGSGTQNDPYLICNVFQLQLMGNVDFEENANVLVGNENLDAYFELGADIDASVTSSWNGGNGFIPIGALDTDYYGIGTSAGFSGSFHGNDYTIDGLFMSRSRDTVGMFGVIAPFAVVTNLRVTNIDVTQNDTGYNQSAGAIAGRLYSHLKNIYLQGSVSGDRNTGGLAGIAYSAALRNIHGNMSVTGDRATGGMIGSNSYSSIISSFFQGVIIGGYRSGGMMGSSLSYNSTSVAFSSVEANVVGTSHTGGLIGYGYAGNLSAHSSFTGDVSGGSNAGGLIGYTYSSGSKRVSNSFARGSILSAVAPVGGLVGYSYNSTEVINSFSNMNITSNGSQTGGLVGRKVASDIIENSFASGIINNSGFGVSGTNGSNLSNVYWFDGGVDVSHCYDLGDVNCNTNGAPTSEADFYDSNHGVYVDGAAPWDFNHVWQAHANDFPSLRTPSEVSTGLVGRGLEEDPFLIGSVLEWNLINDKSYLMGSYFRLTSNLNFSGSNCASMIGSQENHFLGVIDGGGFSISNFSCDADSEAVADLNGIGLIRYGSAAQIKNLELIDFDVETSGSNVGALAGSCSGCLIENINESGSTVNGGNLSGGLVGRGDRLKIRNSFASGDVSGTYFVGGLVGSGFNANIENSAASGDVSGTSSVGGLVGSGSSANIENSTASGDVFGSSSSVGGLVGNGFSANIENSAASGNVSGSSSIGGLVGSGLNANIQKSFATGNVNGSDSSLQSVAGLIGSSNSNTSISDSFFTGATNNTSGDAYGITDNPSATLTNVYWDDIATGTQASNCHNGGDTGCAVESDQTQFYLTTHPVYTRVGFAWDFVNIWQEEVSGFPVLR